LGPHCCQGNSNCYWACSIGGLQSCHDASRGRDELQSGPGEVGPQFAGSDVGNLWTRQSVDAELAARHASHVVGQYTSTTQTMDERRVDLLDPPITTELPKGHGTHWAAVGLLAKMCRLFRPLRKERQYNSSPHRRLESSRYSPWRSRHHSYLTGSFSAVPVAIPAVTVHKRRRPSCQGR